RVRSRAQCPPNLAIRARQLPAGTGRNPERDPEPPPVGKTRLRVPAVRRGCFLGRSTPGPERPHATTRRTDVLRGRDLRTYDRIAHLSRGCEPPIPRRATAAA